MSEVAKTNQLPTLSELYNGYSELALKNEGLNSLLANNPPPNWVKEHPYISNYKYLPIDKVEYLLRKIFKYFKIEILREGTAFNGVYVVVRVHFLNPADGLMSYHDGIGAIELQVQKGASISDLSKINKGAVSMAFGIAKSIAVKDACDHFGNLFGANLNRKDVLEYKVDVNVLKTNKEKLDGN